MSLAVRCDLSTGGLDAQPGLDVLLKSAPGDETYDVP